MIKQLSDFTMKSFKNYTGPIENFNNKNIIFGYNGRGKSSLAKGIYITGLEKYNKENIRIFNNQYIKDNLTLDDNAKIKGVVANFGKKAVDIERKIKDLNNQMLNEAVYESEIGEMIKTSRNLIDNIHHKRKGTSRISKKAAHLDLKTVLERYEADLTEARTLKVGDKELESIKGDNKIEGQLNKIRLLKVGSINPFERRSDIDNLVNTINSTHKEIEIPSPELIDWLNEGLKIHIEKSTCEFCKNPFDYNEVKFEVAEYNKNEIQKSRKYLIDFQSDLNTYMEKVSKYISKEEHVLSVLDDVQIEKNYKKIKDLKMELLTINELINVKLSNFNELISEDSNKVAKIENVTIELESMSKQIEVIIENKEQEVRDMHLNQDKLVKGAIALEIINDKIITENLEKITEKKKELSKIKEDNKRIQEQIFELEQSKSDVGDFATLLTDTLEKLGIDIEIKLDGAKKNYILQHAKSEDKLTVSDISEGEKNLLSLLFFYNELFEDKDQSEFKNNVKLLILDDPISSLDGSNRYYVLEMVKSLLNQETPQVFVSTHVWEDFTDLCYGFKTKEFSFFEVFKNSDGRSSIKNKRPHETPYKMLFQEVYNFSKKNINEELSYCDIYHLPNSIRKIFEEFLSFKTSKGIVPTQSSKRHIADIMNINSNNQKRDLSILLTICNVLSHKNAYNPEEVLKSAKFLMKLIEREDKTHFLAMKGDN